MLYAYVLGNNVKIFEVDNQPLFKLIRDCDLPESNIYMDNLNDSARPEFELLKNTVVSGDTVAVRSLLDLADTPADILNLLKIFGDNGIEIASVSESYYEYDKTFKIIKDMFAICSDLSEKKRRLGIEKATAEGRMGRKIDADVIDRVKRLKAADFSVREITQLCGISRSSYYRYVKK